MVPWSPGEVTSSLLPSVGSVPCAAGQLGRAGSLTSAVPPTPLCGGLDVPPSPGSLDGPAAGAGVSTHGRGPDARRGVPCVTRFTREPPPPGSRPSRGRGHSDRGCLLPGPQPPPGMRRSGKHRFCPAVRPGRVPGPEAVQGPVRGLEADAGLVRVRGRCGYGAVPSRSIPCRAARASRARSAALVPPHAWRSREAAPLCSFASVPPPRRRAPPSPPRRGQCLPHT